MLLLQSMPLPLLPRKLLLCGQCRLLLPTLLPLLLPPAPPKPPPATLLPVQQGNRVMLFHIAVNTSAAASPALPVQPTGDSVSASSSSPSSTQASMNYQSGASVNTGLSMPLIGGIAAVGGVIVVAIGFFAVVRYRKQKELTKKLSSGANPFTNLGAGSAPNATPVSASPFPPNSPYDRLEDAKPLGTFTVISTYTPTLGDELDIQPGDKVTVLCEYDDGWVQGINETKGRLKGVFPKHCVDFGQAHESNRDSMLGGDKRVKRVSSMYGNNGSYGA
ncbi:hypothetical protein BC938DRAFT_479299 [Jimgerdemannia flammicorona]|uniref:SH3 domain-containing protein n=1 Tax=Jimgerdemannia flammicorona TaxID=994334 RepID=A0A433QL41_9FUNG|nr:hypothetical protein BC938DRAFT_479299 [Jimgerdemannia flammicorona]